MLNNDVLKPNFRSTGIHRRESRLSKLQVGKTCGKYLSMKEKEGWDPK